MGEHECVVCQMADSKYKCPRCRARYCSVACSKAHKENADACLGALAISKIPPAARVSDSLLLQSDDITRQARGESGGGKLRLLTEEEKQKLLSNEDVTAALRSKRLIDDINEIDIATDRGAALRRARKNPEFEEFVQKMLNGIK